MIGQGGPRASVGRLRILQAAFLVGLAVMTWTSTAVAETLTLRIDWGGNRPIRYRGNISLSEGRIDHIHPLGVEADEPGSIWVDQNRVWIAPIGPRVYDGIDVRIDAPLESAKLRVELGLDPRSPSTSVVEVPLSKLLRESVSSNLDQNGTRVLLRRAPGDVFRVKFQKRTLIFNGREDFVFELTPHLLPPNSGRRQIEVRLCRASDSKTIKEIATIDLGEQERPIPIRVPLSQNDGVSEGVYDVVIDLVHSPSLKLPVGAVPVWRKETLMSRKIQLLVLDPSRAGLMGTASDTLKVIEEIDPANPSLWDRVKRPSQALAKFQLNLPGLKATSFESGDLKIVKHELGQMAQLAPNHDGHTSWEAYVLTVRDPDKPHILEVEYPSDVPQALAISVMEPNAAGALTPIQFDSGLLRTKDYLDLSRNHPKILKHRVIFWPKTTSPIVLLANHSDVRPAVHGKLCHSAGWEHLPSATCPTYTRPSRLFAAYFDQPLFYQSFGAKEVFDPWGKRSLDDWNSYYQGGSRLIEYLKHTGANGVMMCVASDGGALYPSGVLEPTPRFEKGTFFASGQDPVRKDVLDMLLTMCDREQIRMIPAIRFNASLPRLEEKLRASRTVSEKMGIHLIGPGGRFWTAEDAAPTAKLMGNRMPIYNILDPRVQDAVFEATVELLDRYAASHDSLAGIALQMSYDSYLQLPGPEWGVDDVTIARFEKETGIRVDAKKDAKDENPQVNRFTRRAEILSKEHRSAWLAWRAKQLYHFHTRLNKEIAARINGGNLYLTGANLMIGPMWQQRLRGTPAAQFTIQQAFLEVGIDPYFYQPTDGPILVCPERVGIFKWSDDQVASIEMTRMLDAMGAIENSPFRASMFYSVPSELYARSFDEKGLARVSYTRMESQLSPSDLQNRCRFAHRLAMFDTRVFFDGGRLLPMGQESSIQDLVATYRSLPDVPFQPWVPRDGAGPIQPVVIRSAEHRGRRYYYLVNDSSFPVEATLRFESSSPIRLERLGQKNLYEKVERSGQTTTWSPTLQPYDLIAVCIDTPKNELVQAKVSIPSEINKRIAARIMELGLRAAALRKPPSLEVLSNPSFEKEVVPEPAKTIISLGDSGNYLIPGWKNHTTPGTQVVIDSTVKDPPNPKKTPGKQCVHLKSDGGTVAISSETFECPQTGKLWICAWMRISDKKEQPTVEVILTGKHKGHDFVKMAVLGRYRNGRPAHDLQEAWGPCYYPITDLPFEGLENISVGFRLVGKGEVWIDDVQLFHLAGFDDHDIKQLSQMVSIAEMKFQSNRISECLRLLEGLWPQYLERNVSVPAILAEQPRRIPRKKEEPESSAGIFDRVKNIFR